MFFKPLIYIVKKGNDITHRIFISEDCPEYTQKGNWGIANCLNLRSAYVPKIGERPYLDLDEGWVENVTFMIRRKLPNEYKDVAELDFNWDEKYPDENVFCLVYDTDWLREQFQKQST